MLEQLTSQKQMPLGNVNKKWSCRTGGQDLRVLFFEGSVG